MHWKLKCLAFHLLAAIPGGRGVYEWLQVHATRSYFTLLTRERLRLYALHVQHYSQLGFAGRVMEFGAGGDLLAPLLLSAAGAPEILTYDLARLATVERVNHIISQLRALGEPGTWRNILTLEQLWSIYRIRYLAPADARATGLAASSVDFILSTSTLEHIPAGDIRLILSECKRICSPDGRMSFIIDYHDHYSAADRSISAVNFYRYDSREWKLFNPQWHYQNRMRHKDFCAIFRELGLEIMSENTPIVVEPGDLAAVPLSAEFQRYDANDLRVLRGVFFLRCST